MLLETTAALHGTPTSLEFSTSWPNPEKQKPAMVSAQVTALCENDFSKASQHLSLQPLP